jgi:phthiodiolone/phenolphthiodiolone dimycocerosates ketoreductase
MEIGILIAPAKNMADTFSRYDRCMLELSPDYIWLPDRLLVDDFSKLKIYLGDNTIDPPIEFLDPFITLSAMANHPRRPKNFGIAVTDFIRRSPPDLARACHTLSQLIGTPLNIGFGAGEAVNLNPLGYEHGEKPVAFLEKNLAIFNKINDSGLYQSSIDNDGIKLGYNVPPSTIWIGGQRDRMLKLTGTYADGWIPAWKMPPTEYQKKIEAISYWARENRRALPKFAMYGMSIIGESKQQLFDYFQTNPMAKAAILQAPGDAWERWGVHHPAGEMSKGFYDVLLGDLQPELLYRAIVSAPHQILDEVLFLGNQEELLEEFWTYKKNGVELLVLMLPFFSNNQVAYGLPDFYPAFKQICEQIKKW